jgi:hypothetical protein
MAGRAGDRAEIFRRTRIHHEEKKMTRRTMNRRRFLHLSGGSAAGAAMLASGVGLTAASPGVWALALSSLDAHQASTLLRVARHVFPHDTLDDIYYAGVVEALDGEAAANPAVATLLADGVKTLDAATGVKWVELSPGYQLEVLEGPGQALLHKVKGNAVVSLYNNPLVWRHFGYEGPSAMHGGYMKRGFNDLAWLPDPDEQASPPAA